MAEMLEIREPIERALLVGISRPTDEVSVEQSLAELRRLADTVGVEVVEEICQRMVAANPKTLVGSGKAQQIAQICIEQDIDVVIFDDELTPSQQSNIEHIVQRNVKVIDRTALILDIFALHARTKEGLLQVRLAQNEYLYPRLRGMWAHLASNRMGGGVGSRFGEGESQLEVDRRIVRKRISSIRRELKELESIRRTQREKRYGSGIFKVSLAGYTNAGKSSLLNCLTSADVLSMDKLFATLDSTTRKLALPEGRDVTITDTIGFIRKLPTTLVESFKSTLDEISGADLILKVVDASSSEAAYQIDTVNEVLSEIHAERIECIEVYNKIDLLEPAVLERLKRNKPSALFISAATGKGIDELITRIARSAAAQDELLDILVPYTRGDLVAEAHRSCRIISEEHTEQGTLLRLFAPHQISSRFKAYSRA